MTTTEIDDTTWPEWTDMLGQTYKPGDVVMVATLSYRSVKMYPAIVDKINAVDSKGQPHTSYKSYRGPDDENGRATWTRVEVPSATIRVLPVNGGRASTLQAGANIVKVNFTAEEIKKIVLEGPDIEDD